jgi:glycosyltransferase involved in cell wall biosynthesis
MTASFTQDKRPLISAFVICYNEVNRIRSCLESLTFCDEIIIVDSGSQDGTLDICRQYTEKLFHNCWPGYCEQKRFALQNCIGKWVLNIDADEVISDELREEILRVLTDKTTDLGEINGFQLLRVVHYLGRWWRKGGWYPEFRVRLCRRDKTQWGGEDPHERALVTGEVRKLAGELQHFTHESIADHVASINSLTSAASETLFKKGKRASVRHILLNPLGRFTRFYLVKKGYREGFPGLLVAILEAYSVFLKYVKLWELEQRTPD